MLLFVSHVSHGIFSLVVVLIQFYASVTAKFQLELQGLNELFPRREMPMKSEKARQIFSYNFTRITAKL